MTISGIEYYITCSDGEDTATYPVSNPEANPHVVSVDLRDFAEFHLTVPAGISLIHIPLKVTAVDGEPMEITTVGDVFDTLGGATSVSLLITYDTSKGRWLAYLGDRSKGTSPDLMITADLGMIAVMHHSVTLTLKGDALGSDGLSQIVLNKGINLVGVPLKDERLSTVSNLLSVEGIRDNAIGIIVLDASDEAFKLVAQPDDSAGDVPIIGGQSFIIIGAREAGSVEIIGEAWDNVSGRAVSAPAAALMGHKVDGGTSVLEVHGLVVDQVTDGTKDGFRVIVKNLSTGASLSVLSGGDTAEGSYSMTFVDAQKSRAARVGDVLEIHAQTPSPRIGVQPLRHIVSTDDVLASQIRLPDLIAYEIPAKTELLPNYPNPFNPETWIPFRLAEDAFVTLTIYDMTGKVVRTIEVGHQPAAVYESKDKAIHWDGRNNFGERVASGVYFPLDSK